MLEENRQSYSYSSSSRCRESLDGLGDVFRPKKNRAVFRAIDAQASQLGIPKGAAALPGDGQGAVHGFIALPALAAGAADNLQAAFLHHGAEVPALIPLFRQAKLPPGGRIGMQGTNDVGAGELQHHNPIISFLPHIVEVVDHTHHPPIALPILHHIYRKCKKNLFYLGKYPEIRQKGVKNTRDIFGKIPVSCPKRQNRRPNVACAAGFRAV